MSAQPTPAEKSLVVRAIEAQGARMIRAMNQMGGIAAMTLRAFRALFTTRFEMRSFLYQLEQMGVKSFGIAAATAIFVGIVMAIQFAFSLERFGARESTGRIVGLSEARELAPSLTALVVGCRIGAGIAAELGSMAVTEQIDAIRALGADPIKKLVVPRMLAGIVMMPMLTVFALVLGIGSAAIVCNLSFGMAIPFFVTSALDSIWVEDFLSGIGKTPFFGFLIAVLGSYYGITTRGGTEGVGRATTTSVVVVAISILIADALLTQFFMQFMTR
ncbi:MlaE family ABC transporter permease [Sandaracinus amylolyticus]|uniref:ABC-type transport protein n=1 Tax=Sandaracinus amylolyticus TaxID=927083 RepID=A0A0F6YGF1_9BACT|nr:ABC transporter permease [Sandaracinus amylolyticus]AKF04641.1 ABC-type transport protein [Sandaracinus amylolyticus]